MYPFTLNYVTGQFSKMGIKQQNKTDVPVCFIHEIYFVNSNDFLKSNTCVKK